MYNTVILNLTLLLALCKCCPFPCICRWKNGKQTSECVNKDLLVIPDGLDATTQVLEFAGNNLRTLHREKFVRLDLINLQRIHLSRISVVSEATFKGLTNLVELDLSDNLLDAIPSVSLLDCPALMRLSLSRNPITALDQNAFDRLSLEWLHLEANKMTSFAAALHLPGSLKGVQLQENPWQCDCRLRDLQEFLLKFGYPFSIEPVCSGPRELSGQKIKAVPTDHLACVPVVTPTILYLEIDQGHNISLACQVDAIPEAAINWYFDGQLLQNDTYLAPGLRLLYYVERGTSNKTSELYIFNANSGDSGTFVCSAENPAGVSRANYTVKLLMRQEEPRERNEPPFEFILVLTFATSLSVLLIIVVATFAALKCRRRSRMRRKRHESKVALESSSGDNLFKESFDDSMEPADHAKEYSLETSQGPSVVAFNHDQISMKLYQERNPDLINGTDVMEKSECAVIRRHHSIRNVRFGGETEVSDCGALFVMPGELRLHPGAGCYKTLPNKKRTAAAPLGRLSREADFLNRSAAAQTQPAYEFFGSDIRHTADGYPARNVDGRQQAPGITTPLEGEGKGDVPEKKSVGCGQDNCFQKVCT
ncbi:unnamed protein product [Phaedon cochleariae]|uniref:Ig-like domain-containing protein n=1 Tax=Phaedon cochleariae TaxID=80249 RepID=A0A9N9SHB0_PHACE|nr:unnamed protein product [Phaedon cochleariae]